MPVLGRLSGEVGQQRLGQILRRYYARKSTCVAYRVGTGKLGLTNRREGVLFVLYAA